MPLSPAALLSELPTEQKRHFVLSSGRRGGWLEFTCHAVRRLPCLIIAFTTVAMWLIGFANTLRGPTRRVAARFRQWLTCNSENNSHRVCSLDLTNLTDSDRDLCPALTTGHLIYGAAMLEKSVFFQNQISRCNSLAEQALSESEQEFWRRLAHRWEAMLQAKSAGSAVSKPSDLSGELPSRLGSSDDWGLDALS